MEKGLKNFLKKTALYLALFMLPIVALEAMLRQPGRDAYAQKKFLIENTLATNEVLIVGNSLSWGGLKPALIAENCVNVANYNQSFYSDFKTLERYLPQSKKLHTVILPVSAESFYSLPDERSEQMYSAYWGIEPLSGEKKMEHYSAVMIYGFWNGMKKLLDPEEKMEDLGWGASDDIYDENVGSAKSKLELYRSLMKPEYFETCTEYLDRIVALCKANQVRLVLYLPPFSPVFNGLLEEDAYQKEMMVFLEGYCERTGLECYDFNDNEVFPNRYFRDFNHLNRSGAEKLSGMMRKALENPLSTGLVKRASFKLND